MSFHKNLRGDDLHPSKIEGYAGSPIGNVVPEYIGQPVIDTVNKTYYLSFGLTNSDWEIIGAAGSGIVLSAATDVDPTDRTDGYILEWNETTQQHEYVENADSIAKLVDVDITNRLDESILEWDSTLETYVHIPDMQGKSAGITGDAPTITDNGDGSITLSACEAVLYDNALNQGKPHKYSIASATFTLTQELTNYIVIDYNLGTPIYKKIINVNLIDESSVIPVVTAFRDGATGIDIYAINWDSLADGLSNKLHMRFVKTDRFGHESGIALTESAGRIVNTTLGKVWFGAVRTDILAFTSATDRWSFWYHSGGEWTEDLTTTTYNNTQYDNGTNLVAASNNRFLVNWIFRCACDPARGAYVLGSQTYASVAEANDSDVPELPPLLSSLMFVVGRIIVQTNAVTASSIDSAFVTAFTSTAISIHNNLGGLNDGDFQHLTQDEYEKVQSVYSEKTADYTLLTTDFTVGVTCSVSDLTMTLFSAADLPGKVVNIKKLDSTAYSVLITPQAGETIDGDPEKTIGFQWTTLTLQSTGTNWIIL